MAQAVTWVETIDNKDKFLSVAKSMYCMFWMKIDLSIYGLSKRP